jgi:hypothetical protein
MAFIEQTSLGPPKPNTQVFDMNTIIRKIQIDVGAYMTIDNNGGAIRIVSPDGSVVQGMIVHSGSNIEILGN